MTDFTTKRSTTGPCTIGRYRRVVLAALLMLLAGAGMAADEVPVREFFRHSEFTEIELSPTGEYLAVTVPQDDRTLLAVLRTDDKSIVSKWDYGKNQHPVQLDWVNDERFLVRVAEKNGLYDFWVGTPDIFAANADGTQRKKLVFGGTYQVVDLLEKDPRRILVQRAVERPNLFRLDVYTGRLFKEAVSPVESGSFAVDHDGNVRYAFGMTEDMRLETYRREGTDRWVRIFESDSHSGLRFPIGFTADNSKIYMAFSKAGEPAGLLLFDPETNEETVLFQHESVQFDRPIWNHDGTELLGVAYQPDYPRKKYFDGENPQTQMLAGLDMAFPDHDVVFTSRTRDGRYAIARVQSDVDPGRAYLFDMETGKATFMLANRGWIDPERMSPMKPVRIAARDGTVLHGYLTVPRGSDGKGLPLIMHPHGGPHGPRDEWRFNPQVQFLASRGYAVLQVNYRGSGGYGQKFERVGYQRWGLEMQDDLVDSVQWAIDQGIADKDRLCIFGASYGGYAALMNVVRAPDLYRCTIGYVGVYSLPMMATKGDIPDSEFGRRYLRQALPEGEEERRRQSPAYNIDRIDIPVMLVHGKKDQRVPIQQFDFLVEQMEADGKKPEVVVLEDKEGHGFFDVDNNVGLYTKMQAFLDRHIGTDRPSASP